MAIKLDASSFLKGLVELEAKVKAGATLYGKISADKMASEAKSNAIWTDRTSNARQSIKGFSYFEGHMLYVGISGGMDYSPYLELANQKKHAILYPTLQKNKDAILKSLSKMILG